MFSLEGVGFAYADAPVLRIRSFRVSTGEIVAIQGDNGTGKTTLLKLLAGLLPEHSGSFSYQGIEPERLRTARLKSEAVFVHQEPYLFSGTVRHNIAAALGRGMKRSTVDRCVAENLELVGLRGFERRNVRKLSGGEVKRVAIARALASKPKVLLLDEPTAAVDSSSSDRIVELIRALSREGRTIVLSTHEPDVAYRVSDRLVVLRNGDVSPASLNIYKGSICGEDESFLYFSTDGCVIKCPVRAGSYSAAVLPYTDVILSTATVDTSAQNRMAGRVVGVEENDGRFTVCLDCGVKIRSQVTRKSIADMRIGIGKTLYAIFKASAVQLY